AGGNCTLQATFSMSWLVTRTYKLVLFPHVTDFIDLSAIGVFLTGNPIPTLLADFLHSLHNRHGTKRGGRVFCCVPLIYIWLMSHMSTKGPFTDKNAQWFERMGPLSEKDIVCLPLVGISYGGVPEDACLTELLFEKGVTDIELWKKIKRAWGQARKEVMSKKNCIAQPSYTKWVKGRIAEIKLPFAINASVMPQEPEPILTVPIEETKILKSQIAELKKKNEELVFKNLEAEREIKRMKMEELIFYFTSLSFFPLFY
ncbi:hypothetical protein L195_g030965, partial [Trifolium pratense]